ncbi:PA2169 family four-helix-bundle protein [Erythrobacter crassostreae]|uniref:PA2169 family four-helix-bundle protein n=1 Tax=Erythrobacter crassostreae TaxID=2828328 RepID=A0A9X1F4A4_9SPHN|nr:PA2169 family four-helix-bundle protein [Erythrobacter crassostrea]MBV7259701.1 PA2169 family four-helix-bundle protein [Erythrobacter crassostrea]
MTQNIEILKSLTQTTFDSVEGYRKAAEHSDSRALTTALEQRADMRAQTLAKLNNGLQMHGEKPIVSVSMTGSVHQTFLKITEAISGGDKAAVERVDEGEEYIAEKFRDVLTDEDVADMDLSVRTLIQDAYNEISKGEKFANMLEEQYA